MESPTFSRWLLILILAGTCVADDIDLEMDEKMAMNIIRQTVNQTKADTLNLPSNATSIRENITDTFSCEGLTYGYYADVDNDCQVFHVCLPTQSSSGRNTTYRWSFICPQETVFNQEVLVCTRPRDAIDCADSPMYYDKNMDIGKIEKDEEMTNKIEEKETTIKQRRKGTKRKQNIVLEVKQKNKNKIESADREIVTKNKYAEELAITDVQGTNVADAFGENIGRETDGTEIEERIVSERKKKRGGFFRFKADVV